MGSKSIINACIAKLPLYKGLEVVLLYEKATSITRVSISAIRQLFIKHGLKITFIKTKLI
ncbi:hypothetical protein BSZ04_14615 [Vibrio rotiferianus]|nr:hypothetical protein BSZ04_14615 [Vibrio rotiferianus]